MSDQPLVTVLMPVYNAAAYLKDALQSILEQTFTRFELLIIDDGSTDQTLSLIASFTDPRIRVVRNEKNLGISATLNKGLEAARCDLVARMDADDISYPQRLQQQFDYLAKHPDVAMVSSWARVVDEEGMELHTESFRPEYYYFNMTFTCWIYHPTVMYRRNHVLSAGGYSVPYSEDFELFWQLMRRYKIYTIPRVLLDYRVTGTSLHGVTRKREYEEYQQRQVERNIAYYLGAGEMYDPRYVHALRHDFSPLLKEKSIKRIAGLFAFLDRITEAVLQNENPNKDQQAIRRAAFYKQDYMLRAIVKQLGPVKGALLLMATRSFSLLLYLGIRFIGIKR
jgi:glycosyltransferase involved in cell wall biosynthesis